MKALRTHPLRERIPNEVYFENFVSLVKQLAPDGKRVSHVGLSLKRNGEEKGVKIEQRKSEWEIQTNERGSDGDAERVEIRGTLRFADATKKHHGMIEIIDQHNAIHKVIVPLGIMADIVRPMFDYDVVITGTRDNRDHVILEDIEMQNEE